MRFSAGCKHCGAPRTWERAADGELKPAGVFAPKDGNPYPCDCSPIEVCEPRTSGERLVSAFAGGMGNKSPRGVSGAFQRGKHRKASR